MPRRRVFLYTSSDDDSNSRIRPTKLKKLVKKSTKKPTKKLLERIKSESSDNWSESDLETESDLSFVVSDSESDEVHLAKKSARGINSKSVQKNSSRSTNVTKSAQLKLILGKKSDSISLNKFQTTLTKSLFRFFNVEIFKSKLPSSLPIKWNERLISAAGRCMYEPKISIELSPKIIKTDRFKLRDILLHEMVHAVAFLTNKEYGHGKHFYRIADQVEKLLPKIPRVERCHNFKIDYKYTFYCLECGMKYHRQRRTINIELDTCGECRGRLRVRQNR